MFNQNSKKIWALLIFGTLIGACGERETFDRSGEDSAWTKESGSTLTVSAGAAFGTIVKILDSDTDARPTHLGSSIPNGVTIIDITGGATKERIYKKEIRNRLGQRLVSLSYKLSYEFGVQNKGIGAYVHNIVFTPLSLHVAPTYEYKASAVLKARNIGTSKFPIIEVSLAISHHVDSIAIAAIVQTDEFKIDGFSGHGQATIRDLFGRTQKDNF